MVTEAVGAEILLLAGPVPVSTWVLRLFETMLPLLRDTELDLSDKSRTSRIQVKITAAFDAEIEAARGDVARSRWAAASLEWALPVIRADARLRAQLAAE